LAAPESRCCELVAGQTSEWRIRSECSMVGELVGAVVATNTVTGVPEVVILAGFGTTPQIDSAGAPVQVKNTQVNSVSTGTALNCALSALPAGSAPSAPSNSILYVAGCPGETLADDDEPVAIKSEKVSPDPLKLTVCGELAALSLNDRVPVSVPPVVGEKLTATVHIPPAITGAEVEQVVPDVSRTKGAVMLTDVKVRLAVPVLVSVTVCGLLVLPSNSPEKLREVGDRLTAGAPVPTVG